MCNKEYPCPFPFNQLYIVPRASMDIRFCSYYAPVFIQDQNAVFSQGKDWFYNEFKNNKALVEKRNAFIEGNYEKAGCNPGCFFLNKYLTSKKGYKLEDYKINNQFELKRMWLTVGPDCNITCRYCLEPDEFVIDYNSCDTRIMDIAGDFVKNGGYVLLTGGETFLPKFKFLETLKKLSEDPENKGYFDCHTNGTYLNKEAREIILKAPLKTINVSIDTFRPDLFNYLRRGANFDTVFSNVKALAKERDAANLKDPHINILCALLVANHDHIIETARIATKEGFTMSINAMFQSPFSPDFSNDQGLHNLSLSKLQKLYEDIEVIEENYGDTVDTSGIKGQLQVFIDTIKNNQVGQQVVLGEGNPHAPRKFSKERLKTLEQNINKLAQNREIYLWGCGSKGIDALKALSKTNINITGFIDSNIENEGKNACGKTIFHYASLEKVQKKPYVIITSMFVNQISSTLDELGFESNNDYKYIDCI